MTMRAMTMVVAVAVMAGGCFAQTLPEGRPSQTAPDVLLAPGGMPPAMDAKARAVLDLLRDRRETLKDFTAEIDYSVYHPITDERGGKRGTVDVIMSKEKGPQFTVDFTVDTDEDGKPKRKNHQQIIFDGGTVVTKDFGPKQYMRMNALPPGGKAGGADALNGPVVLPIGIDPAEVARRFEVKVLPTDEAGLTTLRLVPRAVVDGVGQNSFDFKQLDVVVDEKLQLPVRMEQTAKNKDVTTIKLTKVEVNTGKAKMGDAAVPSAEGWVERK